MDYKQKVYQVVKKIPKGKVTTYGNISKYINNLLKADSYKLKAKITPRMVGVALHHNPDPTHIPCHRVVNRQGEVAQNFAFGGRNGQKEKLLKEGVPFKTDLQVNLERGRWKIF